MDEKRKSPGDSSRVKLTPEQVDFLNDAYRINSRPSHSERDLYARRLGIGLDKVKNWFQNKRAKDRKDCMDGPCLEYNDIDQYRIYHPKIYPSCSDLYKRRRQ